jgi:hypothetical protein
MGTLLLGLVGITQAVEVPVDSVPGPVTNTVTVRFPDVEVAGFARETTEAGAIVYEVSLEDEGKAIDLTLTPEGALVLIEKEISRKDLPAPVAQTLDSEYPKARFRLVEEAIKVDGKEEKLDYYEVLLMTRDKQLRAVQLSPEGKVLKVEKKGEEGSEED